MTDACDSHIVGVPFATQRVRKVSKTAAGLRGLHASAETDQSAEQTETEVGSFVQLGDQYSSDNKLFASDASYRRYVRYLTIKITLKFLSYLALLIYLSVVDAFGVVVRLMLLLQ